MSEYYRDDEFREGHHHHHHHPPRGEGGEEIIIVEDPQGGQGGGMFPAGGGFQQGGQFGYQDPNYPAGGYGQGGNFPQTDEFGRREFPGGNMGGDFMGGNMGGNYMGGGPQGGYVDPYGGGLQDNFARREFYIVSEMNEKVVEIEKENVNAGANIVTYKRRDQRTKNQLWFLNPQGFIVSALNGMVFGGEGKGHDLKMMPLGAGNTQWRYEPPQIVNNVGQCLDIKGDHNRDGANLCAYDYNDKKNQHWRIEYID